MSKPLTVKEFASLGGKARWKGKTKKQKSLEMQRVSKARLTKKKKKRASTIYTEKS